MTKKRKKIGFYSTAVLLLGILISCLVGVVGSKDKEYILKINGIKVPREEFQLFLQDEKAMVVSYFNKTYGVAYEKDFWYSNIEGEIPIEVAKSRALDKLIRFKIEQQEAKNNGLIASCSYDDLMEYISKVAEEEGRTYGPEQLTTLQAYHIYHSNMVLKLKEKFYEKAHETKEEDIKEQYIKLKDSLFKRVKDFDMEVYEIVNQGDDLDPNEIDHFKKDMEQNIEFGGLQEKYNNLLIDKRLITLSDANKDENSSQVEVNLLQEVLKDDGKEVVTSPIYIGDNIYIGKLLESPEIYYEEYESVRGVVIDLLAEELFQNKIDKGVNEAKVKLNSEEMTNISIQ